ncbi:MAG TPA: putative Ig domain-containing protein, partial [Longimicrobiales bacterium]|nr:putative Ig domain-containing protein [Longimicrobiales bacterium]
GEPAGEGLRIGFQWSDDPSAPRERTWVTGLEDASLVASFGGMEARLRISVEGQVFGVAPGVVTLTPDAPLEDDGRWFPEGTEVSLLAQPNTGYGFGVWTGDPAGQPNPASVVMNGPVDAGVTFELVYGMPENRTASLVAGRSQGVLLEAENGAAPVRWVLESGTLPSGLTLRSTGLITGVPLEEGTFPVHVRARDAQGLEATGVVTLEVAAPVLAISDLTGPLLMQAHGLTPGELSYLDFSGNRSGAYDLGDFRSYVLRHPPVASAATAAAPEDPLELTIVRFPGGGGS